MDKQEERALFQQVLAIAGIDVPEVVLPNDHQIIANGLRFHYLDWGGAAKPAMLLLHGGGLNAHTWDLICADLHADFRCIAVDARGHGDSEWSPIQDYSRLAHCADVEAIVEQLGIDRFVLVGMSMGGSTAIAFAGRHPEKLASLVIVDMGPEVQRPGADRIRQFSTEPVGLESIDAYLEKAVAFNPLRRPEVLRRSLYYNLRQGTAGKWYFKHDQRRYGSEPTEEEHAERTRQMWADVARISCPTLVVRGGKSDVFSDENAEKLASTLANGNWVRVEGAGHTVQGDQPKALIQEMRRFLATAGR